MESTTIAVDVAKSVFEIAVSLEPGKVAERKRLSRAKFERFFADRGPAVVVMEACGMAHFWGRWLTSLGHRAVLLPPLAVRPYVTRNKTDRTDAKGILEAYRNEEIRPVPVKTEDQQCVIATLKLREAWKDARTARLNTVRGILRELGLVIPKGATKVVPFVWDLLNRRPEAIRLKSLQMALAEAVEEIQALTDRIKHTDKDIRALARRHPVSRRLMTIPGIGPLNSTALVADIGDPDRFPSGRKFASFLGLTPKESSTGERRSLGRINKKGNTFLRTLLIHGARSVVKTIKEPTSEDRLLRWTADVLARRGHNKAVVALANRMARIVWSIWRSDGVYSA